METELKTRILAGLAFAQVEAHQTSVKFGRWGKERNPHEIFALIHRDASRALETIVIGDGPSTKLKDCTRAEETLADVIIQILDIAAGKNLHVAPAVVAKMEYNELLSRTVKKDF